MNRVIVIFFSTLLLLSIASGVRGEETTDKFGRFGKIVWLPKVGHDFSVPKNWLPQLKAEFARIVEIILRAIK